MRWLDKFHLSVTERKGFIVLLIILFVLIAFRLAFVFWPSREAANQQVFLEQVELFRTKQKAAVIVPHAFDPNSVSDSIINTYLLPSYTKENWVKARQRGKKFGSKEDLLSIYGMDTAWFLANYDSIYIGVQADELPNQKIERFNFDPNSASEQDFVRLGLPKYLAERILKYRLAGGKFKTADDLKKIYGFPETLFAELRPYIQIKNEVTTQPDQPEQKPVSPSADVSIVNLNTCDSLQLLSLKGIGPTFASRILKYRKQLGGFYKAEQLLEVYGFDVEKLATIALRLEVNQAEIKKLSVNKATFKELLAHPYLSFEQVKTLVNYREKVGPFKNLNGLSQLEHFTTKDVERLQHYLQVD